MIRKFVSSCFWTSSSGVSWRSCCFRSLKSATRPARYSSLALIAVRPEEIFAKRARRARAHPGSPFQASISSGFVARWSRTSMEDGVRWKT